MSNSEWGMFLFSAFCVAFSIIVIIQANKRIDSEKEAAKQYKALYQRAYKKLLTQKMLNVHLEKDLSESKEAGQIYEKMLLDTEEQADDIVKMLDNADDVALDSVKTEDIAEELNKRDDVKSFTINLLKYSICGGKRG